MDLQDAWARIASDPLLSRIGVVVLVALGSSLLVRIAQFTISRAVNRLTLRHALRKTVAFVAYAIAFFAVIAVLSDSWGEISILIGVAGAGIAFALQEVIVSIAGWVALTFGGFYAPGDRVRLGGIVGDVIDIGVLRTTLMETGDWIAGDQYNGRIVRVANSFVFKEPVYNYSADFPFLWDEIKLPIHYRSDWRAAEQILERAAHEVTDDLVDRFEEQWHRVVRKFLIEKARVAPRVTIAATGDYIELTLRYITEYKARRSTKDAIARRILAGLEAYPKPIQLGAPTFEVFGPAISATAQKG